MRDEAQGDATVPFIMHTGNPPGFSSESSPPPYQTEAADVVEWDSTQILSDLMNELHAERPSEVQDLDESILDSLVKTQLPARASNISACFGILTDVSPQDCIHIRGWEASFDDNEGKERQTERISIKVVFKLTELDDCTTAVSVPVLEARRTSSFCAGRTTMKDLQFSSGPRGIDRATGQTVRRMGTYSARSLLPGEERPPGLNDMKEILRPSFWRPGRIANPYDLGFTHKIYPCGASSTQVPVFATNGGISLTVKLTLDDKHCERSSKRHTKRCCLKISAIGRSILEDIDALRGVKVCEGRGAGSICLSVDQLGYVTAELSIRADAFAVYHSESEWADQKLVTQVCNVMARNGLLA